MALVVVLHRVNDYDAWRKVYDSVGQMQKDGGVTEESVYRTKDDPNNVLVLHRFRTMAEAEAFASSAELRAAMERSGVAGAPRIEFYDET